MRRPMAVIAATAMFLSACSDAGPPESSDAGASASEGAAAPVEVASTPQQIGDHAARVTGELGGPEAFARTWWAVDRGYGVDQIVGSDVQADGQIDGAAPAGEPLGLLAEPVALGDREWLVAAPSSMVLTGSFDGDSRAQQQYIEDVDATLRDLYEHAERVVRRAEEGPELDPEVRATGTVTLVLLMLALRYRGDQIVEAILFGELEGRQEAADFVGPDRNLNAEIARVLRFACAAEIGESPRRTQWREQYCEGDEPVAVDPTDDVSTGGDQEPATAAPEDPPAAVAWVGTLPHSPIGVFQSGTVATNEVVVEVTEEVAQATIVYELQGIPVFTEAGEVFCSADLLFVFEFAPIPVDDPGAFELLGRVEFLEANRRGSDCSRASPAQSGDQPATALFTTDTTDSALAHLELRVAGQDVYDQPIQLTFG